MIKIFVLFLLLMSFSFANNSFEKNQKCSECHVEIYKEYQTSQHANATIFKDPIHKAIYDKHPQKNKLEKYRCAKCHTPAADNLDELLQVNNGVIPDAKNESQNEAVACAYCHRIVDVKAGTAMNENVISKEPKKYFANLKKEHKSKFHTLETNIEVFENGKLCMGCHMHKTNKKKFEVCSTEHNNMDGKNNCITCHMPKVKGSISNLFTTKTHAFHGFPGLHGDIKKYLGKYVLLDIKQNKNGFSINVNHKATHSLTLHPLRMAELLVTVKRAGKTFKLEPVKFFKVIGTNNKPSAPWLATQIVKDKRIGANETKEFNFNFELKSEDVINVEFGYFLVNPKVLKKFGLEEDEESKKFRVISSKTKVIN